MLESSKKRFGKMWSGRDGRNNNKSEVNFCQDKLASLDITSTYKSKGHLSLELDIGLSREAIADKT